MKPRKKKRNYVRRSYYQHPCKVFGQSYPSISEAARDCGIEFATLSRRLHTGMKGYILLPYDAKLPRNGTHNNQIPHIHAEGNWYYSQQEAGKDLHVAQTVISYRIRSTKWPDYYVHLI